jgi:hypothetical protein
MMGNSEVQNRKFSMWSLTYTGRSGQVRAGLHYDQQAVSQYVLVFSPISDYWPEYAFSMKFHLDSYRFVIV